jgi:hypothetical protein
VEGAQRRDRRLGLVEEDLVEVPAPVFVLEVELGRAILERSTAPAASSRG